MLPLGMLPWVAVMMTAFLMRTSVGKGAGESGARAARPIALTATRQSKMLAGLRETRRRNINAPHKKKSSTRMERKKAILITAMRRRNEILVIRREGQGEEIPNRNNIRRVLRVVPLWSAKISHAVPTKKLKDPFVLRPEVMHVTMRYGAPLSC